MNTATLAAIVGGKVISTNEVSGVRVIAADDKITRWERLINKHIGTPIAGKTWEVSHQAGGYRLEAVTENGRGSSDVSPRLPAKAFEDWIWAFIKGFDLAKGRGL